jgi:hypothetical protein
MSTGSETATFGINLTGNVASAAELAAESVEQLRGRIAGSTAAIREANSLLKNLRGSTDEVSDAKKELKARIAAEKDAVGAATLAQIKQQKAER